MGYDLLIRGGTVVDGSGLPRYRADVAVSDGTIVEVGKLTGAEATRVVDADGLVVAPGFIDPHTHLDPQLCWDPLGMPSINHGVTTVMTGNCSVTVAPCRAQDREAIARLFHQLEEVPLDTLTHGLTWQWESFGEYLDLLDESLGVNVAAMVGHSALRYYVMGPDAYERSADDHEIHQMREVLRQALMDGAAGFSTSGSEFAVSELGQPIPSRQATIDELFAICDVLGETNRGIFETDGGAGTRIFAEHVRDVAGPIALRTGRPVMLGSTVHEWTDPERWRGVVAALADFQDQGARIFGQTCPGPIFVNFTMERPLMFEDLPAWKRVFSLPTREDKLRAFRDPSIRDALQFEGVDDTAPCFFSRRWDLVTVAGTRSSDGEALIGTSIAALAERSGVRVIDALLDLVIREEMEATFLYPAANADDDAIGAMLRSPQVVVGSSDAGAHVKTLCGAGDTSLLLSKWVRELALFTLEEAVKLITFDEASALGLARRGLLRSGYAADVVVFAPDLIDYLPTRMTADLPGGAQRLWRDAVGIPYVVVNGEVVLEDGSPTGARSGRVLRGADLC